MNIMPPRSRREKSASVSSAAAAVNGSMPPPSPPMSPPRASPVTRRKAPSVSKPASTASIPAPTSAHAPRKTSIPKFALALVISLIAELGANEVASWTNTGELAQYSKRDVNWPEIIGLISWKVALLAICWFGGYDGKHIHRTL